MGAPPGGLADGPIRKSPSILAGGISSGLSPMASASGGGSLGGNSISALRPPSTDGSSMGARPLPSLSGLGGLSGISPASDDMVEEAPTIAIKRPARPTPEPTPEKSEAASGAASAPSAPSRSTVEVMGWTPTDDDILPSAPPKRKGLLRR
ncbi:MAG: hypothetical protein KGQ66_17465 [Acidobacteriota bacterium]|nr:hypothetical protein [Acidobacteriota bacterium]